MLNAQHKHQFPDTPLSALGREQAQALANRLEQMPIDAVYASDYARALETAEIIAQKLQVQVEPLVDLRELRRPSEIRGKEVSDLTIQKYYRQTELHYHEPDWHFSDEENFVEFRDRAIRLENFFRNLAAQNPGPEQVVVVSHGITLGLFIGVMAFGPQFSSHEFTKWIKFLYHTNTGLTICECSDQGEWRMETWNDQAHLG